MIKIFLVLLVSFGVPTFAFAQTTWQGLVFGTSLAQVRDTLSKKGVVLEAEVRTDSKSGIRSTWDAWNVKQPMETQLAPGSTFHFKPRLIFFKSDKLAEVQLHLDVERYRDEFSSGGVAGVSLALWASKAVFEELIGKYGTPAEQSDACELSANRRLLGWEPYNALGEAYVACTALWKGQGQLVTLEWEYYGTTSKSLNLSVLYTWVQSGL